MKQIPFSANEAIVSPECFYSSLLFSGLQTEEEKDLHTRTIAAAIQTCSLDFKLLKGPEHKDSLLEDVYAAANIGDEAARFFLSVAAQDDFGFFESHNGVVESPYPATPGYFDIGSAIDDSEFNQANYDRLHQPVDDLTTFLVEQDISLAAIEVTIETVKADRVLDNDV